jgi:putative hydrolase of the HAD superfamily
MKAFVFDLDGVICVGPKFTLSLEREFGIDHARWKSFFVGPFLECVVGRRDLKVELAKFAPQIGWAGEVDELLRFWFDSESIVCKEALACVGALRARGHRCHLGTNQERYRTEYIAVDMGLAAQFDGVHSSSLIGHAKPSREYFESVQDEIGSSDILLVDDQVDNVRGAELFGWKALHYRDRRDLPRILEVARMNGPR